MSMGVNPRRRYDASRRQAQAAQTRSDVVTAGRKLFEQHGYSGTTLAAIARSAGVSVETIYRAFDGKAGLFRAVVEDAVAGDAAPAGVPVQDWPESKAVIAEPNPRRKIELYASMQSGIHARIAPLMRVLVEASASDPTLAEATHQLEQLRLAGVARFVGLVADQGGLRTDLPAGEAIDVVWALNSHAVHDLLVNRRRWTSERYRDWLADMLARSLLPDDLAAG